MPTVDMSVGRKHLREALLQGVLWLVDLALVWDESPIGEDGLLGGHDGRVVCGVGNDASSYKMLTMAKLEVS